MSTMTQVPYAPDSSTIPDSGGRRLWIQAIAGVLLFLLIQIIVYGVRSALQPTVGHALPGPAAAVAVVLAECAVCVVMTVWGYRLLIRWTARRRAFEMSGPDALHELAVGMGLGTGLMCAVFGILALVGAYRISRVGWSEGILVGAEAGVLGGFTEEMLMRGVALRLIETRLGSLWALTLTSFIFGLLHLFNPEASLYDCLAIVLEAGLLLGACYLLTRRLWLSIGVHSAWNFVQGGIFGSDISGTGSGRGLFEAAFSGPDWLTGGDMGVEGSVVTVVVCTVAGVVVLLTARRRGMLVPRRSRRTVVAGS